MKIVLNVLVAIVLATVTACTKRTTTVINYDNMVLLDAEELGEGGIGTAYKKDVLPALRQYVTTPAEIVEELDSAAGTYKVSCQGQSYTIYSQDMDLKEGQNWGNATFAFFDIVNRQLQPTSYRFYAINSGNDLGGMFLTREEYDKAIASIKRKTDWPYLPKPEHPWYGQTPDE